jgi:hypothetical protein
MEREVEEKIAQLALLEQENKQLKWQAHILENMLLDMDKQVRSARPGVGTGQAAGYMAAGTVWGSTFCHVPSA